MTPDFLTLSNELKNRLAIYQEDLEWVGVF